MPANFTGSLAISGSLIISGSILTSGSITISGSIDSASYAEFLGGLPSSSFASASVFNQVSASFASTSGSIAGRVNIIETSYATTGSNNFTRPQQISDVSNAISFTSTASLYTAGGLRVGKDSFVSGTAYFNNVVVYGTSSIQYITSSQVNIGTNIITVNTDTPAVRFGGLAVFDSGSTALTGSLLWDSQNNRWIYSNPSGSTYDGGMLISGPRNTTGLGNEVGTTACAVMIGQGADHITSSGIFSYGNATCFYGNSFISSSGLSCFGGNTIIAGCLGIGTATVSTNARLSVCGAIESMFDSVASEGGHLTLRGQSTYLYRWNIDNKADELRFFREDDATSANGCLALTITSARIACFASTVCAPTFVGNSLTSNDNITISKAKSGTGVESANLLSLRFTGTGAIDDCTNIRFVSTDGSYTIASISGISGPDNIAYGSLSLSTRNYFTDSLVESMRITNRGNVGIRVVPKSWGSSYSALQIGGYGALWANTGGSDMQMGSNAYYDGTNYRYIATDFASRYFQFSGNHIWSYVASGTTGCTFTFCEAMRITCNGVVGIKTTSTSTEGNLFLGANSTEEGGQLVLQKATNYSCATHLDNYANQFRILSGTDTGTTAAHMILDHTTMNACFYGTLTAPIITSTAANISITGKAFLTTLSTANALYIITAQPEAGSGTSAAALISSRTNQNPSVQTIVSSSSLSFFTDGYNLCLCSNLGYGLSARWGIIRLA